MLRAHDHTPPVRMRPVAVLAAAAVAAVLAAGTAGAVPAISGSDADVWNAANPVPAYTITSDTPGTRVVWTASNGERTVRGNGATPLTVRLPDPDDGQYRLVAQEVRLLGAGAAQRAFRVDLTPPEIEIEQPLAGGRFDLGEEVEAEYDCEEAVTCDGSVPDGDAIDTSRTGPAVFSVRAVDDAGNEALGLVDYTVVGPEAAAPPETPRTTAPSQAIVLTTPVATPATAAPRRAAPLVPRTVNARALRPSAGTVLGTRRPVLRWRARGGARLYNVQVFRVRGTRAITKVFSAFPRTNRLRVPAGRLAPGQRYVWRVWPYVGRRYTAAPLGLSHFSVRR